MIENWNYVKTNSNILRLLLILIIPLKIKSTKFYFIIKLNLPFLAYEYVLAKIMVCLSSLEDSILYFCFIKYNMYCFPILNVHRRYNLVLVVRTFVAIIKELISILPWIYQRSRLFPSLFKKQIFKI